MEKRLRYQAAATQELFDTRVFQLKWNSLHADLPSSVAIGQAAARYRGRRDADWYDDTAGTHRPFDVLICQASNLGWGASMHRLWAWILVVTGIVGATVLVGAWWLLLGFSFGDGILALVIPALAPVKELITLIKTNFENARAKETAERTVNSLWDKGMNDGVIPTGQQLRSLQDKILILRQTNTYVPDWLDSLFHARNEATMRDTVTDRISHAGRNGHG